MDIRIQTNLTAAHNLPKPVRFGEKKDVNENDGGTPQQFDLKAVIESLGPSGLQQALQHSTGSDLTEVVKTLLGGLKGDQLEKSGKAATKNTSEPWVSFLDDINSARGLRYRNRQRYDDAIKSLPPDSRDTFDNAMEQLDALYQALSTHSRRQGVPILGVFAARKVRKASNTFANVLGQIRDDKVLGTWIEKLLDNDATDVRYGAAVNIHRIQTAEIRDRLIEKACKDKDSDIRIEGLNRLPGHSSAEKQREILAALSRDSSEDVKHRAGMLTGKRPVAKALYGWMIFKGKSPKASQAMAEQLARQKENMSESAVKDEKARALVNDIKELAIDIEDNLNTLAQENALVQQTLVKQYGKEQNFPKADHFRNLFYRSAKKFFKTQQSTTDRMLFRSVDETQVLELTKFLLEIAKEGAYYFLEEKELSTQNLGMVKKLLDHRLKLESELGSARMMLVKNTISQQQADSSYARKKTEVDKLEAQFAEASKDKDIQSEAYMKLHKQLQTERVVLQKAEERKKAAAEFSITTQSKVDELERQVILQHANLNSAIQIGLLTASKEELNRLIEENERTLNDKTIHTTMDQADQKRYEAMADLETTKKEIARKDAGKTDLAQYGEGQGFEVAEDAPPATQPQTRRATR